MTLLHYAWEGGKVDHNNTYEFWGGMGGPFLVVPLSIEPTVIVRTSSTTERQPSLSCPFGKEGFQLFAQMDMVVGIDVSRWMTEEVTATEVLATQFLLNRS